MESKDRNYRGIVCISSVYVKEPGFKDYRFAAFRAATDLGYQVKHNPEDYGSTQEMFEKCLKNDRPIFILLIGQEPSQMVKKECKIAMEFGLPIFAFLLAENEKIPSKTEKIMKSISKEIYGYDCTCFHNSEELYCELKKRLIAYEDERIKSTAKYFPQRAQVYTQSAKIIEKAKKRVVICQKTSSLLLGPRKGMKVESDCYRSIINWLKSANEEMEFLHLFSYADTKAALADQSYDIQKAKKNLVELCANSNIKLAPIIRGVNDEVTPCAICDNNLLVLLKMGTQGYNLLLPQYITDGDTISKIVADLQGMNGQLLFAGESGSTSDIERFYS